jgi:hypothetical protein
MDESMRISFVYHFVGKLLLNARAPSCYSHDAVGFSSGSSRFNPLFQTQENYIQIPHLRFL